MILITGATGIIGRPLVASLTGQGITVRAVVRSAAATLPAGVDPVRADLARPEGLAPALNGVSTLFVHTPRRR